MAAKDIKIEMIEIPIIEHNEEKNNQTDDNCNYTGTTADDFFPLKIEDSEEQIMKVEEPLGPQPEDLQTSFLNLCTKEQMQNSNLKNLQAQKLSPKEQKCQSDEFLIQEQLAYLTEEISIKKKQKEEAKKERLENLILHAGEKKFHCPHCEYRCRQKVSLQTHLVVHHTGDKIFQCDKCDHTCNQKVKLVKHMLIHSNETLFRCHVCNYFSIRKGCLKTHMLTHTGEKRFYCHQCDYRCRQKGSLQKHMLIHTGEKAFQCNECDYRFTQKGHLQRHMITHSHKKS